MTVGSAELQNAEHFVTTFSWVQISKIQVSEIFVNEFVNLYISYAMCG